MVRFQMKTSTRPQTIAVVKSEVDIKSFRENPEWYEIIPEPEQQPVKPVKQVPVLSHPPVILYVLTHNFGLPVSPLNLSDNAFETPSYNGSF